MSKVVHFEVTGRDGAALQKFYGDLFGWEFDTDNPVGYGLIAPQDDGIGGGVGQTQDGSAGAVTFYVATDDIDKTLAQVTSLGGSVAMPATDVTEDTTIALFADPEGHVVGLTKA